MYIYTLDHRTLRADLAADAPLPPVGAAEASARALFLLSDVALFVCLCVCMSTYCQFVGLMWAC